MMRIIINFIIGLIILVSNKPSVQFGLISEKVQVHSGLKIGLPNGSLEIWFSLFGTELTECSILSIMNIYLILTKNIVTFQMLKVILISKKR